MTANALKEILHAVESENLLGGATAQRREREAARDRAEMDHMRRAWSV